MAKTPAPAVPWGVVRGPERLDRPQTGEQIHRVICSRNLIKRLEGYSFPFREVMVVVAEMSSHAGCRRP